MGYLFSPCSVLPRKEFPLNPILFLILLLGYRKKGIPEGQSLLITARGNFHGRTFAAISTSTDPNSVGGFGPLLQGYHIIPYNDIGALEDALEKHGPRVCGFMVEPIQGMEDKEKEKKKE